jgi:hypothetical protein
MKVLIVDTETTGLPISYTINAFDKPNNWPHLVSLSWALLDTENMKISSNYSSYVIPDGWTIPPEVTAIHGISEEMARTDGNSLNHVIDMFMSVPCDIIVSHNSNFDKNVIINAIVHDLGIHYENEEDVIREPFLCSMKASTDICKIQTRRGYKWPKLSELYYHVMKKHIPVETEHQALFDTLNLVEIIRNSHDLRVALGIDNKDEN